MLIGLYRLWVQHVIQHLLGVAFAPVRDFLVFDDLPLIETAEAGSFDRRDVGVAPQPKTYILGSPDDLKFRSCLTLFAARLRDVATAVDRVLNDEDLVRHAVSEIVRNFIERERQHMAKEERMVFPAALDVLQSADWADIALRMADRYDPLAHPAQEAKYDLLQRNILEMEEEAERADRTR